MSICYDTFSFPEGPRILTLKGMEVLITMAASPGHGKDKWPLVGAVRAMENAVFHVFPITVGTQWHNVHLYGGAMSILPTGAFLAQGKMDEEDVIIEKLGASY